MHNIQRRGGYQNSDSDAQLFSQILDCASRDEIVSDILAPLCRHLNASSAVYLQYIRQDDRTYVGQGDTFAIARKTLTDYSTSFFHLDPISIAALQLADGTSPGSRPLIVSLNDVANVKKLRNSFYYNEFLRPIGIDHVLAVFVPVQTFGNEVLVLGLHRPADMPPFEHDDARLLEYFRPAISSVLTNMSLQTAFKCANTAISAMSNGETPIGLVIMDDRFNVVHANHKGLCDLSLMRSGPTDDRLKDVIRAVGPNSRRCTSNQSTVLTLGGSGNLTATINRTNIPAMGTRLVITTAQSSIREKILERARTFDFSAREMEVAQLVATGLANENIAHQLGISTRTVENHLRAIYLKADVNSRTQLVARMITL
jgi:DNA-binding NarL/FixJ family response regulator